MIEDPICSVLSLKLGHTGLESSAFPRLFVGHYPTALKGCRGIVFTHGVRMGGHPGGRVGGRAVGKSCPGCISETIRCRKLIRGRDIG